MNARGGNRSLQAHLLLLAVAALWGSTFVLIKDALRDASPMLFNLLRMAIAFTCLAAVYRRHLRKITRHTLIAGAIVGACLAMGYQLQTTGLALTTPSKSAFITGLVVVLVPLLAAIPWMRTSTMHAPRLNAWGGAILAFVGVMLLTLPPHASHAGEFSSMNTGDLLSFGCAIGFALHVIALAHLSPRIDLPQLATLQIGFCAVFMAVSLPLEQHTYLHWSMRLIIALLIASVLATAAAFTIQSWAQQILPATHTALILALEPLFAALTSFVALGEHLRARAGWGAVLILAGIILTELLPAPVIATAHESVESGV